MAQTQFYLAGIPLLDFQIPEKMPWGGAHRFTIHKLPGGKRVFDAMGPDNKPITWTGMFLGPNAEAIARAFDVLRQNGSPITLQWGTFNFFVVIKSFEPVYERSYQIPYTITCEVVQDNSAPNALQPDSVDDVVRADMANTLTFAESLGMTVPGDLPGPYSTLTGATVPVNGAIIAPAPGLGLNLTAVAGSLTTLRSSMAGVNTFVGISASALLPVSAGLAGARSSVGASLIASETTLTQPTAGVIAGADGARNAENLSIYAAVAFQAPLLRSMNACLARMQVNLAQGAI